MIEVYDLRRLSENGETIDEVLEKSWLTEQLGRDPDIELAPLGDGHALLKLLPIGGETPDGPIVRITGTLDAQVSTPCVRCLSDLTLDLRSKQDVTLFPAPPPPREASDEDDAKGRGKKGSGKKRKRDEDDDEDDAVVIDPSEADANTYTHHQIDLPTLVREALLLEIPMNPACVDEAACAGRTQVLIASVTPSDESAVDPRWAALEALKSKLT